MSARASDLPSGIDPGIWARLSPEGRAFLLRHEHALKEHGGGEWSFAVGVLCEVRGLDWRQVRYQHPFTDLSGRPRFADFVILGPGAAVALEVDGYDKTGRGGPWSRPEFDDFLARQNALTLAGFQVLRFSNDQVGCCCRECVASIESALRAASRGAGSASRGAGGPNATKPREARRAIFAFLARVVRPLASGLLSLLCWLVLGFFLLWLRSLTGGR